MMLGFSTAMGVGAVQSQGVPFDGLLAARLCSRAVGCALKDRASNSVSKILNSEPDTHNPKPSASYQLQKRCMPQVVQSLAFPAHVFGPPAAASAHAMWMRSGPPSSACTASAQAEHGRYVQTLLSISWCSRCQTRHSRPCTGTTCSLLHRQHQPSSMAMTSTMALLLAMATATATLLPMEVLPGPLLAWFEAGPPFPSLGWGPIVQVRATCSNACGLKGEACGRVPHQGSMLMLSSCHSSDPLHRWHWKGSASTGQGAA